MELLSINPSNIPRDTHHITTEPSVPSHTQTDRPPSDTLPPLPEHPHSVREREKGKKRRKGLKCHTVLKWVDTTTSVHSVRFCSASSVSLTVTSNAGKLFSLRFSCVNLQCQLEFVCVYVYMHLAESCAFVFSGFRTHDLAFTNIIIIYLTKC